MKKQLCKYTIISNTQANKLDAVALVPTKKC